MKTTIPLKFRKIPFKIPRKVFHLNNFEVFPDKIDMFRVFYSNEHIGSFFAEQDFITSFNNNRNLYFFIRWTGNVIGTIAFELDSTKNVCKLEFIRLKTVPKQFLYERIVLFEKR